MKTFTSAWAKMLGSVTLAASLGFAGVTKAEVYEIGPEDFSGSFITSFFKYEIDEKTISTTTTGEIKKKGLGKFLSHTATDFNAVSGSCETNMAAPEADSADQVVVESPFFVVKSNVVLTFEKGQVFLQAVPVNDMPAGSGCFYLTVDTGTGELVEELPGSFDLVVEYKVIGGTGDFAGASGVLTSTSIGTALEYNRLSDGSGDNWFGGVTGTLEGSFCTDCP